MNPGSPSKDTVLIHHSESGHSSGYEGEYQEPYAGSPVQVGHLSDLFRTT